MEKRTFRQIAENMCELHDAKNADYGGAFGQSFQEFGIISSVIRLNDKMSRLRALCKNDAQVKDEGIKDTLIDLAAYSIMTIEELERQGR